MKNELTSNKGIWHLKKLDDVCLIKGRIGYRGYTKQDLVEKGKGAISLSPSNIKNNKLFYDNCTYISWEKYEESPEIMIFEGDIIFCKTASIGKMALVDFLPEKATLNPQFVVLKNINCFNKFLYYFMTSEGFKKQVYEIIGGTAVPTLSQKNLGNLEIPIPSLEEQFAIVAKLDQAFAAIDQAKANIEKNIANAKELFQSKLNQIFSGKEKLYNYELKRFDEICVLQRGFDLPTHERVKGNFPLVSSNGITDRILDYKITSPGVVTGRSGSIGNVHYIEENFWPLNTSLYIKDFKGNFEKYIYYFLKSIDLKKYSSGAGVPTLNRNFVHKDNFLFVNVFNSQKEIAFQLDQLQEQTKLLVTKYEQKLANLEELKKSILEKAFKGELV